MGITRKPDDDAHSRPAKGGPFCLSCGGILFEARLLRPRARSLAAANSLLPTPAFGSLPHMLGVENQAMGGFSSP